MGWKITATQPVVNQSVHRPDETVSWTWKEYDFALYRDLKPNHTGKVCNFTTNSSNKR